MNAKLVGKASDEAAPVSNHGTEHVRRACTALANGDVIALSDGADTSLVLLGSTATSASTALMIRAGSGLLFTAARRERLRQLVIPRMATDDDPCAKRFHVAVDAARGITTGISAADRARTIRLLSDPASGTADFVRPGHVLPVSGDITPLHPPGAPELALALVALIGDPVPIAAYCALTSHWDPSSVAGPEEGAAFARQNGLAYIARAEVLTAFYQSGTAR